jgi:hypothetical protein
MYYTSQDINELEAYNTLVVEGEGYDGVNTIRWADIVEHPNGLDFAILKHPNYDATLTIEESLGAEWYPNPEL